MKRPDWGKSDEEKRKPRSEPAQGGFDWEKIQFWKRLDMGVLKQKTMDLREKWESRKRPAPREPGWRERIRWAGAVCLMILAAAGAVWLARWEERGQIGKESSRAAEENESRIALAESESLRDLAESESLRAWEESLIASVAESVEESIAESEAEMKRGPELTEEQAELLNKISEALAGGQMEACARLMEEQKDALAELFYDVMDGQVYLYQNGSLYTELEGRGLALKKSSLVFYGDFAHGSPDGMVTALQTVHLDYPRYDYAAGNWHDGSMYGYGTVGYCYYDGSGQENQTVRREGLFVDDLMYGDILYETANAQGETATWNMTVSKGVLVLDERWTLDKTGEAYQLRSNENGSHAYVIAESAAGEVRFQNLLLWE